jgi:hypothetical protein
MAKVANPITLVRATALYNDSARRLAASGLAAKIASTFARVLDQSHFPRFSGTGRIRATGFFRLVSWTSSPRCTNRMSAEKLLSLLKSNCLHAFKLPGAPRRSDQSVERDLQVWPAVSFFAFFAALRCSASSQCATHPLIRLFL